jgi:hypothetical protein
VRAPPDISSGADARYSWFHPPDGATFEAPYEDADAWAAVRAAVEREFGKVRTEALARRATTEAEAQAEAKATLASTNSAKTNPSKAVNGANASTKPHAASAKPHAAQAGGFGAKRAKRAAPHDEADSSGAGAPVAKRARPGPAARARARASNMQRKMQAE